jgi:hypothetical protein
LTSSALTFGPCKAKRFVSCCLSIAWATPQGPSVHEGSSPLACRAAARVLFFSLRRPGCRSAASRPFLLNAYNAVSSASRQVWVGLLLTLVAQGEQYASFRKALETLKGQDPVARAREEREQVQTFEANLASIRARRTNYRRMLADALTQRSHMLDSMIVHKQDEDLVRAQLYKLRALPDHASREGGKTRFSPFSIILAADQAIMLLVFALAVAFPNSAVIGNVSPADAAQTPFSFYTDIALLVLVGLGFLMAFLVKCVVSFVVSVSSLTCCLPAISFTG